MTTNVLQAPHKSSDPERGALLYIAIGLIGAGTRRGLALVSGDDSSTHVERHRRHRRARRGGSGLGPRRSRGLARAPGRGSGRGIEFPGAATTPSRPAPVSRSGEARVPLTSRISSRSSPDRRDSTQRGPDRRHLARYAARRIPRRRADRARRYGRGLPGVRPAARAPGRPQAPRPAARSRRALPRAHAPRVAPGCRPRPPQRRPRLRGGRGRRPPIHRHAVRATASTSRRSCVARGT